MYIRDVYFIHDHDRLLDDADRIAKMQESIRAGDVYIARRVVPKQVLLQVRGYLGAIARNSIPNYQRIEKGCPNFHRLDRWDPRSHVKACFHSFSFFPWNHDVFGLFDMFRPVFHVKNMLNDLPRDSFLGAEPEKDCTARLSFQYYPKGIGGLNRHQDPADYHQITAPIMIMSKKGEDFRQGGAYVERGADERLILDDICDYGDVIYFNARCYHGVERIDPEATPNWLSLEGRWMLLFVVNKLASNPAIADSLDLETRNEAAT